MAAIEYLPPHNIEAEEAVLGAILLDGDVIWSVRSTLKPEQFFREKNRMVYEAMLGLADHGEAIDQVTVAYALAQQHHLETVGGNAYLIGLLAQMPTSSYAPHYAGIVAETAKARELLALAGQIAAKAQEVHPGEVDSAISWALDSIVNLQREATHGARMLSSIAKDAFGELAEMIANPGQMRGIPTPWSSWSRMGLGFERGKLYVLASRPARGKTRIAGECVLTAAKHGTPLMVSLEMSATDLVERFAASAAGVNLYNHRNGQQRLTAEEEQRFWTAYEHISSATIAIDDRSGLTVGDIEAQLAMVQAQRHVPLVVIDYVGLIDPGKLGNDNESATVKALMARLKALARRREVPILALMQLNRDIERRQGGQPRMADMMLGGEADADQIWYVVNRDVDVAVGGRETVERIPGVPDDQKNVIALRLVKGRNIPGHPIVILHDDPDTSRICEFDAGTLARWRNIERSHTEVEHRWSQAS